MFLKTFLITIFCGFFTNYVACIALIQDEHIRLMPKIFRLDDFQKCNSDGKIFCNVEIRLNSLDFNNPSEIWKSIEVTKTLPYYYNHNELFYGICLNDDSNISNQTLKSLVLPEMKLSEFRRLGLKADVVKYECFKDYERKYEVRLYDIVFLITSISYIALIIIATMLDLKGADKTNIPKNYLMVFSLKRSFVKVRDSYSISNNKDLDFIQGIRVFMTLLVSISHLIFGIVMGYITNTECVEKIFQTWIVLFFNKLGGFVIQPFFLISAFFLSYQSFQFFENRIHFSIIKYFLLKLLNRYFRLLPSLLVIVAFCKSVWYYRWLNMTQPTATYAPYNFDSCQKHWWTSLILIQNVYENDQLCVPTTWYISADMQLYTISIIILIVLWKFQNNLKSLFVSIFLLSVVLVGLRTYINDYEMLFYISLDRLKFANMLLDPQFMFGYIATPSHFPTYIVGLGMGLLYFNIKSGHISNEFLKNYYWCVYSILLPVLAIGICCLEPTPTGVTKAIISGFLKPLYIFGLVFAILGMSQTPTNFLRRILGSKPMMCMANFTYSMYLINSIMFTADSQNNMVYISTDILSLILLNILYTVIWTFLLHVLVELPFSELQNQLISKPKLEKSHPE